MFGGAIGMDPSQAICGGRHESHMEGYNEVIESKDIVSFSFCGGGNNGMGMMMAMANNESIKRFPGGSYYVKLEDNKVQVSARGGSNSGRRDGTYFIVKLENEDLSILKELQEVVDKYQISKDNGHCVHVDGLPPGIGDLIDIEYASGEKIYKENNQCPTVAPDAAFAIYDVFHKFVQKYGYDFNSSGSNVKLYDDADEEYVQGTWKGEHFGDKLEITFNGNHVTVTVDGKVTDDNVEYTIYEGSVVTNKLKEGKDKAESYYDYVPLNGLSTMKKKNWFTMTGYFMGDSYSTCDLHNFDKEKPKDEE